ncbi:DUF5807 family protein [Halohasta salina]|uniref:DUF5807 family protein n=1 Tax=Halohasta salina TaxID=2961621 RepID=UPI0020A5E056|nr:DUF5807 family protein [Halohasta salina]
MEKLQAFLAGERLDDVAIYIDDGLLGDDHSLGDAGTAVDTGIVLVVPGEAGRNAFQQATGIGAMEFAKEAMDRDGEIEAALDGGVCPADGDGAEHTIEFVLSFAEAQNEEVGGLYEEGDVIHAYAHCSCGVNFSQKWLAGSRERPTHTDD